MIISSHVIKPAKMNRSTIKYVNGAKRNIMPTMMESFKIDPNNPKHKQLLKILNDI